MRLLRISTHLLAALLVVAPALAQTTARRVVRRSSAPATCRVADVYFNTTDAKLYRCTATNTWTETGGSGVPTGATNRIPYYTSATALGNEAGFEYDPGPNTLTVGGIITTGAGYTNFATQSDSSTTGDFWRNGTVFKYYDGSAVKTLATTDAVVSGQTYHFNTASGTSPADATTYYLGHSLTGFGFYTTDNDAKIEILQTCTIKAVAWKVYVGGTLGSNENVTISLRKNNTTDTALTSTDQWTASLQRGRATGLSIAMTTGDFFSIKIVTPTWATNPTSVAISGDVLCQ